MKNTFENSGGGFPYEHRPAADQGRDAYHENRDAQGSLVSAPERERALTDYERLKRALYEFGRVGHEHMTPDRFFQERGFPDLAHAIREGWKDYRAIARRLAETEGE